MPLGSLGYCRSDVLVAEKAIKLFTKEYCSIMSSRVKPSGLPAYIQPPPNSVRWQPRGNFALPAIPDGTDQLVLQQTIPLGYDGILISLSNIWNGTGLIRDGGLFYEANQIGLGRQAYGSVASYLTAQFCGHAFQLFQGCCSVHDLIDNLRRAPRYSVGVL